MLNDIYRLLTEYHEHYPYVYIDDKHGGNVTFIFGQRLEWNYGSNFKFLHRPEQMEIIMIFYVCKQKNTTAEIAHMIAGQYIASCAIIRDNTIVYN